MDMVLKITVALLIAIAAVTTGALFEDKPWIKWAETLRIIAYALLPVYLVYFQSAPEYLIYIGLSYALLSLIWLYQALTTNENQLASI